MYNQKNVFKRFHCKADILTVSDHSLENLDTSANPQQSVKEGDKEEEDPCVNNVDDTPSQLEIFLIVKDNAIETTSMKYQAIVWHLGQTFGTLNLKKLDPVDRKFLIDIIHEYRKVRKEQTLNKWLNGLQEDDIESMEEDNIESLKQDMESLDLQGLEQDKADWVEQGNAKLKGDIIA